MSDIVYGFKIGVGFALGIAAIYAVAWTLDQIVALLIRRYAWSVARWWDRRTGATP